MSITTDHERVTVTCPDCGLARQVHRKTYNDIRRGKRTARCHTCGNAARNAPVIAPEPSGIVGDWRTQAACRGHDPEVFFPHLPAGRPVEKLATFPPVAAAKAICAECPVREICGEVHRAERWGIWGGLTPPERGIRRRM